MNEEQARIERISRAIVEALAEEIYDQLGKHNEVRYDLWLLDDDTVTWRHPTWSPLWRCVIPIFSELNVEELLGPGWAEGLEVDECGDPIVTMGQARVWAEGWGINNGAQTVRDALDAAEEWDRLVAEAAETACLAAQGYGTEEVARHYAELDAADEQAE